MDSVSETSDKTLSKLYIETPTLYSNPLSQRFGFDVFLKLENLQPTGSFKNRGVGNYIFKASQRETISDVYCASGGNAGLAAAFASRQLGIPCTILLPKTSPASVAERIKSLGANVRIHGAVYNETKQLAQELGSQPGGLFTPAFEHPDIWEGHSTLIEECSRQMSKKPDVIVTCVGGGGLLAGIVQGMKRCGWIDSTLVAMETEGANCFNEAIKADKVVAIPAITSIAKSLGSLVVLEECLQYYRDAQPKIVSQLVTDKQAVSACIDFSDDHRILVEPACGASLSAIYSNVLDKLKQEGKLPEVKTVLIVVCGGNMVSPELIQKWKSELF